MTRFLAAEKCLVTVPTLWLMCQSNKQVVVSAATGLFGMGKNVLDVWCNTTFLGDDGELVDYRRDA